ncbi:M20/M25/M40 family metallo-hydrolase [Crocinitomix algicola]|uniref:M20/M25/M40 family metallo-hydrolase n=1 Tax=Crocinitomix algicola TaxID=1740263 RepID=UPI000831EB56|nr:M20/M25/M40 family metallo-hydrolase [Crocinitomix algicola]
MRLIVLTLFIFFSNISLTQTDSIFIRKIYDMALEDGHAYENLRSLCKDIGARITGSAEAKMAINWGRELLESYDFDHVYLQEIKVPHWERGTTEAAWIINEEGKVVKLNILALGGSVGTSGLIEGEVVKVESIQELEKMSEDEVAGKIVFFNRPFDQKMISTFKAYGACVDQRWGGTNAAAILNAKGVVIRSMASSHDDHPHTGSMHYEKGVAPIPGAAISTNDANRLEKWLETGSVHLKMEMDCRFYPDQISHNVIAEMMGGEDDRIITFGGHLDSWDVGEGAHDDGAGIVHAIEALRILKELGYQPNHTLRCVLFMNEENGNFGGKSYAEIAAENKEEHICAIETDRGGFLPMGFDVVGSADQLAFIRGIVGDLKAYDLLKFNPGYGGVDIGPLLKYYPAMIQLGLNVNSQRYFDYHHSEADVFESVNKRELELGAAAMAAMIYLVDQNL